MIHTTLRIADPFGRHLTECANYERLDYVLNCSPGGIGVLEVVLPRSIDARLLKRDGRIGPWRSVAGRPARLDGGSIYLMESFEYTRRYAKITAYHVNTLTTRRIIAYSAGSAYTSKSGPADNLILAYADQQLLTGVVGADRDGADTQVDVSSYLTRQGLASLAPSIAKAATRRKLAEVMRELAEASATAGTYLTYEIATPRDDLLELRTATGWRGVDHRASSGQPMIFSESRGNLENARLVIDYHDEVNAVIAGGQGEGSNRLIRTALDTTRMSVSPFGRCEAFLDMSNVADGTQLQNEADARLRAGRPMIYFTGDLVETPKAMRGVQYDLGDYVTAEDDVTGLRFDVRLDIVRVTIEPGNYRSQVGMRGEV